MNGRRLTLIDDLKNPVVMVLPVNLIKQWACLLKIPTQLQPVDFT